MGAFINGVYHEHVDASAIAARQLHARIADAVEGTGATEVTVRIPKSEPKLPSGMTQAEEDAYLERGRRATETWSLAGIKAAGRAAQRRMDTALGIEPTRASPYSSALDRGPEGPAPLAPQGWVEMPPTLEGVRERLATGAGARAQLFEDIRFLLVMVKRSGDGHP